MLHKSSVASVDVRHTNLKITTVTNLQTLNIVVKCTRNIFYSTVFIFSI